MARLVRQVKTLSGAMVGFILLAMLVFFVLNLIQTRGGPVAGIGGWIFRRTSGEAYEGNDYAAATPATVSPYSLNGNLGPQL